MAVVILVRSKKGIPKLMHFCQSFLGVIIKSIYNVYFHPLSRFPGSPIVAATPIIYVYHLINGSMVKYIESLHEKYGDVVRIHPDELSFVDPSAFHDIYVTRPFLPRPKIAMPDGGTNAPDMNISDSIEDHYRMRKVISGGLSDRELKKQEPLIQKQTDLLVKRLQDLVKVGEKASQEVDILEWYSFVSFDIIGDLLFGESFHALETSDHHPWVKTLMAYFKPSTRLMALHHFGPLPHLAKWFMPNSVGESITAHLEFTRNRVDTRIAQGETRPDIMSAILQSNHQGGLTLEELYSNAALLVNAGAQTSAITCGSTTWFLLKNPSAMEKVQKEISCSFRSIDDITFAAVARLPYLHAVIKEALRLHPPSPLNTSREVNRPGVVVCGHEIPIGVSFSIKRLPHIS